MGRRAVIRLRRAWRRLSRGLAWLLVLGLLALLVKAVQPSALAAALRRAVRGRAAARAGFEREALMRRLVAVYEACAADSL